MFDFTPPTEESTNERRERLRKEALEYIQLASAGPDSFIATHPAPEKEPK